MTSTVIYLDHHATTPCAPQVVDAMLPYFTDTFANAASAHGPGAQALEAVERARASIARLVSCESSEIVFTSGATEADNLALIGAVEAAQKRLFGADAAQTGIGTLRGSGSLRGHLITQVTEHKAVLDTCIALEKRGLDVTYLPVDHGGRVDPEAVREALRPDTLLVSIMWANNEIGTIQPIAEIGGIIREHRSGGSSTLFHTDAAQALTFLDCDVDGHNVDLMSLSGHKAYGPKGVGALYVRRKRPRVRLEAQMHGGGHEKGRRSGTLDVPSIVGFGVACDLVAEHRESDTERLASLRDHLLNTLKSEFPELHVNGSLEHRLPNNLNLSLPDVYAQDVLEHLPTVALSSGSACTSASQDGSYVLAALPGSRELADQSLRFGLGRSTTAEQLDEAVAALRKAVEVARSLPARAEDVCEVAC